VKAAGGERDWQSERGKQSKSAGGERDEQSAGTVRCCADEDAEARCAE
jgi:hypothetical protein